MLFLLLALMNYPEFCGTHYVSQSQTADNERTVNFYFERLESVGATSKSALYPTPGVEQIAVSAFSPGRAHFFQNGREFVVVGTKFHEISQFGGFTLRGTVLLDENPATISSNGDGGGQLFVTSGGNGYIFDLTSAVFTQVTALDGKATMGDSLDGYFLALDADTSTFYVSDLLDGLTWTTGTMFAQRSIASDPWLSLRVNGRYVWLLGEQTSEVWYNSGTSSFPFAPHPSGYIPYGILGSFPVAIAEGQITWFGTSKIGGRQVLRASGFTPEVISDFPLEYAFSKYNTVTDAVAEAFSYLGHTFFRLSFPTEDVTWACDLQVGRWFEWMTWIEEENKYVACRARWHAEAFGESRMLDSSTGAIYRMGSDLQFDVDGRNIRRLRRAPCLMSENQPIFFSAFELDLEPGLGTAASPGGGSGIRITAGVNDYIDLTISGNPFVARVAPGLYENPDAVCDAVISALGDVEPLEKWICTWDQFVGRISIGHGSPFLVDYLFGTGPNIGRDIAETLGFAAVDIPAAGPIYAKVAENPPIFSVVGTDPQVMCRFSDDGGKTWSSEIWRSAGATGEYWKRVRWNRLGRGRRRVFEVSVTDPIPWRITAAYIQLGQPVMGQQQQQARQ